MAWPRSTSRSGGAAAVAGSAVGGSLRCAASAAASTAAAGPSGSERSWSRASGRPRSGGARFRPAPTGWSSRRLTRRGTSPRSSRTAARSCGSSCAASAEPDGPAARTSDYTRTMPKQGERSTRSRSKSASGTAKTTKKTTRKPRIVESDPAVGFQRPPVDEAPDHAPAGPKALTEEQRVLLGDLFAVVEEHSSDAAEKVDRTLVQRSFVFSCERHADQRRASGEDFIVHPIGVAKICAGMRLDTATLCASLLHDTVEDTSASLEEVQKGFGDEIASLVDGVTKLSGVTFQSRDDRQAENYRKMMVAMAQDIRVILIKLADRLHNMRTLGALPKQKQQE